MNPDRSGKLYLSGRFFSLLSVWLLLGILSIQWIVFLLGYVVLGVALVVVTLRDRRSLTDLKRFEGSIDIPPSVELDRDVQVQLTLKCSEGKIPEAKQQRFSFAPFEFLRALERTFAVSSRDGSMVNGHSFVRGTRLGTQVLDGFFFETTSAMGLWLGRYWIALTPCAVHVVPSRERISEVGLREIFSRQRLLLAGTRMRTRANAPDQYFASRRYQYPDSIRFIDWKKSAKLGSLHTKMFDSLFRTHVVIALDLGRGMLGDIRTSRKRDYYFAAAHLLAEHALGAGDSVSLVAFADRPMITIPRITSAGQIDALMSDPGCPVREVATDYTVLQTELSKLSSQRAIVVLLSDAAFPSVQDEVHPLIASLAQKHLVVLLSMVDERYHLATQVRKFERLSRGNEEQLEYLYLYWLNEAFVSFSTKVDSHGASAVMIPERYWLDVCNRVYDRLRSSSRAA